MLQECKICGSKSGVQDNELCALCQRNLMDYMSNQMSMVRQYQQEANQIADPVELKSHYEAMLTIYNEAKSRYLDKSAVDPVWIYTGGADTLRNRISKCQARIDEYKSMIQAPIHSDQSGSGQVFCKYCGKPIDADSTFCKFCGRDLSAVKGQSEPATVKSEPVRTPIPQPSAPEPVREIPQASQVYTPQEDPPKKGMGCGVCAILILLVLFGLVWLFVSSVDDSPATVPTDNQTAQEESALPDYQEIGHQSGIEFVKYYCESNGITKFSRVGWYYPETYSVKDGVHYTASKFDYGGTDHTYTIGLRYDDASNPGKPTVVFLSVDGQDLKKGK